VIAYERVNVRYNSRLNYKQLKSHNPLPAFLSTELDSVKVHARAHTHTHK